MYLLLKIENYTYARTMDSIFWEYILYMCVHITATSIIQLA
jgi:hypothetical protein